MASKKKKELMKANTNMMLEEELTYRELMNEELFTSWQVNEGILDILLDKTMTVIKDKEIAQKVPAFSVVSTMSTMKKAIDLKEFAHDPRKDDIYILAEEGEEFLPPGSDNIGRSRKVN